MSISSTSKVSSSSSPAKRTERSYGAGSEGNPFVEIIDTTNNVLVRDEERENRQQQSAFESREQEEKKANISSSGRTYVSASAIEALSASGVYDNSEASPDYQNRHVNVYDNNQAIVEEDDDGNADNPYLKHLYERNKILEEVDEFV